MKKKKLDLDQLFIELVKHPENVIKLFISPTPNYKKKNLNYTIFAYRKGDSKFLGQMDINVDKILT